MARSLYTVSSIGEDWDGLLLNLPAALSPEARAAVEKVAASTSDLDLRERRLRALDGGAVWSILLSDAFPALRRASVSVALTSGDTINYSIDSVGHSEAGKLETPADTVATPAPVVEVAPVETTLPVEEPEVVETVDTVAMPVPPLIPGHHHWYIKTNVPAWAMLWLNVAAEVDCADHLSVNLPVYYSGFNYFTSTRKYRTLAVKPELRWWPRPDNQGFYIDIHAGLAWYNVAFNGRHRYQDHNRRTPAIGGGIGLGWRFDISRNGRWKLEASIGAGVYRLKYDVFQNCHNGLRVDTRSKTFFGIDNFALSVCYTLPMRSVVKASAAKVEKGGML